MICNRLCTRLALALTTVLLGAPIVGAAPLCPTQVVPDVCSDEATDVNSFIPGTPEFIGSAVLCADANIAVVVNEATTLDDTANCLNVYDGASPAGSGIDLPLVTGIPPAQFGTTFMEVHNTGATGTNSVTVTFRSQSSATQDSSFDGTTADYEANASFGGAFLVHNNGSSDALVTVTYDGFATTSVAGGGNVGVTFNSSLWDVTTGTASFAGSESGFSSHSMGSFGLYGGGNTTCAEGTCSIAVVGEQLGATIFVSPSSTATIVPILSIRTVASAANEAFYEVIATDTHTVTLASSSPDVAITVPEADGAVAIVVVGAALAHLAARRRRRTAG